MPPIRRRALLLSVLSTAAPLAAQTAPSTPPATPPASIPGLERFSLPGIPRQAPTPTASPTPAPIVTPAPVASPSPASAAASTRRASPRALPTPAPTAVPTATPVPIPTPAIEATPAAPAAPATTPEPTATPAPSLTTGSAPAWPWWLGGGSLALLGGWLALRRRRDPEPEPEFAQTAEPVAPVPPPPPSTPRARLSLDLHPTRAGINLLSATVDCGVRVANTGDAPAQGIRVGVRLFSAHAGQDTDLAAYNIAPVLRPATPPFALAPGETRVVRAVVALPHADIRSMDAAGRPMFVPVIAVNALYRAAEDRDGQVAQSFAVGIERADSPKLAPFWLDQPARTVTELGVRAHGAAIETD